MDKAKIFVTHRLPGKFLDRLREKYNVEVWQGRQISRKELLEGVRGSVGIISLLTEKMDSEVMDAAGKQLKVISNYAVGFDNIDLSAATIRGICVTNTPGVLTESVAEHVIGLVICLLKRIGEGDRYIREGKFQGWDPDLLVGTGVRGKVMGIVGLGRIGRWTARLAQAIGMKVIYSNKHRDEEFEEEYGVAHHTLGQLLEQSDVVSLSVPLTKETKGMIGKEELEKMKRTAILINTARGPIVKEEALVWALKNRKIAGAGLDVFENETKINADFFEMNNVVLTPHIASATIESRLAMAKIVVENMAEAMSGKQPQCLVNFDVWKEK